MLLQFPTPEARRRRDGQDELPAPPQVERRAPFCANPECALHVRVIDQRVPEGGNWVTLPDGRTFGRSRFGDVLLCDACGTRRGPVRLSPGAVRN